MMVRSTAPIAGRQRAILAPPTLLARADEVIE